MSLPINITKEDLLKAIEKIDNEGLPKDGDSQYYDVVFKGKKYPPKVVVSYANIFANGSEINRNTFGGGIGTPSFKLLEENGFLIEEKNNQTNLQPKVWFVTQGSTYTPQKGMKYLWAPTSGKDGKSRFYWENLLKVKKGDFIFNYSEGLKGVSIATSDGYKANNVDQTSQWGPEGYRVDIDLTNLNPIITGVQLASKKSELESYLPSVRNKPMNIYGGVNQGYLYEFTKEAGRFIREIYGKPFGNKVIDDFIDNVNLKDQNSVERNNDMFKYKYFIEDGYNANYFITENFFLRFISSLLSKPFVILTGLSGSGKTKLAQTFAMWICEDESQYKLVPVGADWTNREPLLGFPNALDSEKYLRPDSGVLDLLIHSIENRDKPHFLILDEMNLSHVERYFADFLSVMESKHDSKISLHSEDKDLNGIPAKISIPENLFIIGTVNIDETTYMFSPKVLDRANVIEFRVTKNEMGDYLENVKALDLDSLSGQGKDMAKDFLDLAKEKNIQAENSEDIRKALLDMFDELQKAGAEFGYRSASEILRFAGIAEKIGSGWDKNTIIDFAIMQKLLPKLHGSKRKLEPVLIAILKQCINNEYNSDDYLSGKLEIDLENEFKNQEEKEKKIKEKLEKKILKYPASAEKIRRMYKNLMHNGFTSYAEA